MYLSQIKRRRIQPGTTSLEDVRWAYRIFLTRDLTDEVKLERMRLSNRTLLHLRRRLLQSPEFDREKRRQRAATTPLDATMVQWCYRLVRFEVISPQVAHRIAAEQGTLLALVEDLLHTPEDAENLAAVAPHEAAPVTRLYSKSMPRSGHHLLANLLCEYFDTAIHYCEYYGGGDTCCHALPCRRAFHPLLHNHLFLQKSHDFGYDDPMNLPGKYIVQYRHPIPRMQSNFDHNVHVTGQADTEARFRKFIEAETHYFIRFWEKWIQPERPFFFLLSYEELVEQPRETLSRLLGFIQEDNAIDEVALTRALRVMRVPSGSSDQRSVFARRNVEVYRYFDEYLYRDLEAQVFKACPGFPLERMFA